MIGAHGQVGGSEGRSLVWAVLCLTVVAAAFAAGAPATAAAAVVTQSRSDADDVDLGGTTTDLRGLTWQVDAETGVTTLDVSFRETGQPGQHVWVWIDADSDGKADVVAAFSRNTLESGTSEARQTTATDPSCQPRTGGVLLGENASTAVTVSDGTARMSLTFKYAPPGGSFVWAAFGSTEGKASGFDYLPDAANPDPSVANPADRSCDKGAGWQVALANGVLFPDPPPKPPEPTDPGQPPTASFTTDQAEPRDGRPFKLISTSTDPDGSIVSWQWEFGEGEEYDDATGQEVTLERPTGRYPIGLKVTDDAGNTATTRGSVEELTLDIELPPSFFELATETPLFIPGAEPEPPDTVSRKNKPPSLRVRARPARPRVGRTVALDASRSRDDGKLDGFRWDLDGDGEYDDATGPRVQFAFSTPGRQRVRVQATDADFTLSRPFAVDVRRGPVPSPRKLAKHLRRGRAPDATFDRGLGRWTRSGRAFPRRPLRTRTLPISRELETHGSLGGNYADIPQPIGADGRGWLTSFDPRRRRGLAPDAAGDLATGMLVSPRFRVKRRYLTFRIGGDDDRERGQRSTERVEVWARTGRKSPYRRVSLTPAGENERLEQARVDLGRHRGRDAFVAVVDASSQGHINIDDIDTVATLPPLGDPAPVDGWFDSHTHGMAHQAFGGLQGIRTIMGVPGGRVSDYHSRDARANARRYREDMRDSMTHFGGSLAKIVAPLVHRLFPSMVEPLHQQMHITEVNRAYAGGMRLMSSLAVTNEALEHALGHVTALDGGPPRGDIFSGPFEDSEGHSENKIQTTPGRPVIEAHVAGMRQLAALNSDWMEIVYSPAQAYDAISRDKLAVVLGTEVDDLGQLGFATAQAEVDYLWRLGIRQVTPVHAINNRIGGPPLFQDLYNTTNDLMNRPVRHARRARIANDIRDRGRVNFGRFFRAEVDHSCDPRPATIPPRGECVEWRHAPEQLVFTLDFNAFLPLLSGPISTIAQEPIELSNFHPAVHTVGEQFRPVYPDGGQRNLQGLTAYGHEYIRALIRRGMLIDLEHMSDRTIDDVVNPSPAARGPVWSALPEGRPGCDFRAAPPARGAPDPCFRNAYPLMSSHTSFRGQSLHKYERRSLVKGYWPREFERTPAQIEYIRRSGGTIAPVTGHDPVETPRVVNTPLTRPSHEVSTVTDGRISTRVDRADLNDCAGSSKSWIQAYLYGVRKMRGTGVGLSTDMAVVGSTAPRFQRPGGDPRFPTSCPSSYAHQNLDKLNMSELALRVPDRGLHEAFETIKDALARSRLEEEALYPQYNRDGQRNRLEYTHSHLPSRGNRVWQHQTPAGRRLDFNVDGVKTFGALPDLIQDAVNLGVAREDLLPLMRSAQSYIDMWDKAYAVTGCRRDEYARCEGGDPAEVPADACRNTCPNDPGRGHLLDPAGRRFAFSDPAP